MAEHQYNMIGLTRKKEIMKIWLKVGVTIFYVLGYFFEKKYAEGYSQIT